MSSRFAGEQGSLIDVRKIALGSAQFGLPYGVANVTGQVGLGEIREILALCQSVGINTLDTAIAYGNSEEQLGKVGIEDWHVVSKLPALPAASSAVSPWVEAQVLGSLKRLNIDYLDTLLLHRPAQLLDEEVGDELYKSLLSLKRQGLVGAIGISIYEPEELDPLVEKYSFDVVQTPYNVLDRRIARSGRLDKLVQQQVEVHARSAFLQGLLLMDYSVQIEKFGAWRKTWQLWHDWLGIQKISALEGCLRFVLSESRLAKIVLGVDSVSQMREILNASYGAVPDFPMGLSSEDRDLLNPSRWSSMG